MLAMLGHALFAVAGTVCAMVLIDAAADERLHRALNDLLALFDRGAE